MEYNDSRDHHDEHKEEKFKYEFEKYTKCPHEATCPMYCPLFQTQQFAPMMPWQMRDDDEDFYARPFRPRPFYPRPFYPRPFPFFFPFFW